ncbi:1348_t:CDS:2, partial [Dentiscutata heterogama]
MLQEVKKEEKAEDLKMNHYTKIPDSYLQSSLGDQHQTTDPVLDDIADALEALDLLNSMQVGKFLAIAKENIVYEVPLDNRVITELVKMFRTNDPIVINLEDADNSYEISMVNANIANTSLKTIHTFLLQEE